MRLNKLVTAIASAAGLLVAVSASAGTVRDASNDGDVNMVPSGKGYGVAVQKSQAELAQAMHSGVVDFAKPGGGGTSNGIVYHGGPVMLGTPKIYYIWYGNWSNNASAVSILTDFASNIGGSGYEHINSTYYDGSNAHVSGAIQFSGAIGSTNGIGYPYGTSLSDGNIQSVVANAVGTTGDTNAIYFVLTSADVTASSGFCTQYCGWHTHGTIGGRDIKYSFVGNPDRCPSACEDQTTGPNGNAGADGMASIIAHESEEAISDPDLNAWYDRRGAENADKCAWTFGNNVYTSNGANANIRLGNRDFLIQQNWVNANGGLCAMSF